MHITKGIERNVSLHFNILLVRGITLPNLNLTAACLMVGDDGGVGGVKRFGI